MSHQSFVQRIESNVRSAPDRVLLSDEYGEYATSRIWEISGRVYAYLLGRGIGREDVVLVHLPRCAETVAAMLGVFRAGAAVVVLEDMGPNAWVDYVRQDVRPRLIVDSACMAEVRLVTPMEGYCLPDLHDLAYITYTTGTTGQSKGVLHEYGSLERAVDCSELYNPVYALSNDRNALVITLHSAVSFLTASLAINAYVSIVPRDVYDVPDSFYRWLCEKHINFTYMSPWYIHRYGIETVLAPEMKYVTMSFEPVNSVYSDKIAVYNDYGMTESGGGICEFLIDKPYDVTPIGKPFPGVRVALLDESGQPVRDGELGEICVENVYCRGYLNLPEQTAEQFRDGLYHTRDLGMRLSDGNLIMYGRLNDALKTRDGYIIALEIEVAARRILGRSSVYVKVFPSESEPVICLYTDFPIDFCSLKKKLLESLPPYKIPSEHVQLDHFEYKNGKVIRVFLKNPRA